MEYNRQAAAATRVGIAIESAIIATKSGILMEAKSNKKSLCLCIMAMVVFLLPYVATGQVKTKRMLTEADYSLWSNFSLKGISGDGKWASYSVSHTDADTLFVHQLEGKKRYAYPNGSDGAFAGDYFVCKGKDSTVHFLKPGKGIRKTYKGATGFTVTKSHFIVQEFKAGKGRLCLYTDEGLLVHIFENAVAFSLNVDKKMLAFSEKIEGGEQLFYVDIAQPAKKILIAEAKNASYGRLTWNEHGTWLYAMKSRGGNYSLVSFDTVLKKSFFLTYEDIMVQTGEALQDKSFTITEDGKRIFFSTKVNKEHVGAEPSPVQVWNAADKALYPIASKINHWKSTPHLAMWEPDSGRVLKVTDSLLPWGGLIGKGLHALTHNPHTYEPQEKPLADRDIYLTDLTNGQRKLLLQQQDGSDFHLMGSPDGHFVIYLRDKDWHSYNIATGLHINLTKGMEFSPSIGSMPGEKPAYGIGGWCPEDSSVLLYDEYDVWRFSADGSQSERLTKGRESGKVFRIVPYQEHQKATIANRTMTMGAYDLNDKLLLSARASDYSKNGYYLWERGKGTREIAYTAKSTKNIMKAKDSDIFVWTEEDYGTPIRLMAKTSKSKNKIVYSSNKQQSDFLQGSMEVVQYLSPMGTKLSGLLYYPANFEKGKLYPMIVNLYEVQSKDRFVYVNPTLYNANGFNIANLTAKGYFVFLPDTVFETEQTGDCALRCVETAVSTVLQRGEIDSKRIGLIGHSFGGYETDYIITKSRLFACAVAGAAITDLVSAAHAVAPIVDRPNFFKVEHGQARMDGSLFEEKQRYIDNSPLFFADGVQTPLLSWTGQDDPQVLATQTMEFYMALRRLGKEHVMLVYPGEEHNIEGKIANADLTRKIESWFARYLQAGPLEDWMKPK